MYTNEVSELFFIFIESWKTWERTTTVKCAYLIKVPIINTGMHKTLK